jgi:hypothetical protein
MGSRFRLARLTGARDFAICRELVAEALRVRVDDDPERLALVGAVLADGRCYREWRDWLEGRPDLLSAALEIFEGHPDSGCREALRRGHPA